MLGQDKRQSPEKKQYPAKKEAVDDYEFGNISQQHPSPPPILSARGYSDFTINPEYNRLFSPEIDCAGNPRYISSSYLRGAIAFSTRCDIICCRRGLSNRYKYGWIHRQS